MLKHLKKVFLDSLDQIEYHYKESKKEIARNNAILLLTISVCGVMLVSVLLVVTPIILPKWHTTVGHWLILLLFGIYAILGAYEYHYKLNSYECIHWTTLSFMILLMVLILYINLVPYPNSSATLTAMAMVALPVIFIIPIHESFLYLLFTYIIFLYMNQRYIAASMVPNNVFNATAGFLVGVLVSWINTNIRALEHKDRQDIVRESNQDQLTGIWNKAAAEKRCLNYIQGCIDEKYALIIVDIDFFKQVNDTLGHHAGDMVLSIFGDTLRRVFRSSDIVGRIGGDEFIILMENITDDEIIEIKMKTMMAIFYQEVYEKMNFKVTCSYGAIIRIDENMSYYPMFEMADQLLYHAKRHGKNKGNISTISQFQKMSEQQGDKTTIDYERNKEVNAL